MTFESRELSNFDGQPVELYEFRIGDKYGRYTSAADAQTFGDQLYEPVAISRGPLKQTGEPQSDEILVNLPTRVFPIPLFLGAGPADPVWLTIRSKHVGSDDAKVMLIATITSVKDVSMVESEITVQTLAATFARPGLRLGWDRQCPYALYDKRCRVDRARHQFDFIVQGLDGTTVYSDALANFPDGWFTNGYVEFVRESGVLDRRGVFLHQGIGARLLTPTTGIQVDRSMRILPGCDRTITMCQSKFDNVVNCGAVPDLPGKSPFDGSPVF